MNEKSLEKNLANLERELINLQTAHEIGLGSVRYWEYDDYATPVQLTYVYAVIVLIEVSQGERLNPILDSYSADVIFAEVYKSNIYENRYAYIMTTIYSSVHSVHWKIVSTSKLNYHYGYSEQEAEDWIGEDL